MHLFPPDTARLSQRRPRGFTFFQSHTLAFSRSSWLAAESGRETTAVAAVAKCQSECEHVYPRPKESWKKASESAARPTFAASTCTYVAKKSAVLTARTVSSVHARAVGSEWQPCRHCAPW